MGYLQEFLFTPDRARTQVRVLSGGERARLLLAKLFSQPANILVLDEPTNDLDVDTLELLEAQLVEFPGTVILISHDREFLDHVAGSVFFLDGEGVCTRPLVDSVTGAGKAAFSPPSSRRDGPAVPVRLRELPNAAPAINPPRPVPTK